MVQEMAKRNMYVDDDLVYTAQYIEFDKDHETLNYLIWRQFDCKRNSITLLYKCLNNVSNVDSIKLSVMVNDLKRHRVFEELNYLLTGHIFKKQLVYTQIPENEIEETIIVDDINFTHDIKAGVSARKEVVAEYFYFADNFRENLYRYIKNKIC
jgi:hypothetical protein